MVINHGGDSGTMRAIAKDPRGKMHEMYIIVLQCKIAPSTYVETVPSTVCLYKSFKMTCCIFNNSERTLDLELNLENVNKPRILWTGSCSRKLGLVEPSGSLDIVLEAVPQNTSLQSVSGIRITDSLLMRTYQFDDICHIYVVKDETMSG